MPANPTLVVEDSTGTEKFSVTCESARRVDSLVEMWSATGVVDRSAWLDVRDQLDEVADRVRIERGDGSTLREGRFIDDSRDGNTVSVQVNSYEQDAVDAQPTDALEVFQNVDDSTVAQDAIDSIPTLTTGTVDTVATGLSFSFAHAERSKQLRDAAEPGGVDLRFNPDRTVDFLDRLGTDKPNTAISSTDQTIVDSLSVSENSKDPVTHVRGLGAQQGDDQVSAEAVINSYSGGRQVWRKYENKDIVNQSRLQAIVDRLAEEFDQNRRRIKVEAGLVGVDVSLGDRIQVTLPSDDIDRLLRIVRLEELVGPANRFVATLTNRTPERGGARKRRDDLQRFNSGYQGFVDRDTDSYGWQPVEAGDNATRPYPYPSDVVSEQRAEVIVNSIPYRAFSRGAASAGGAHSHTVDVTHPAHDHDVTHPTHDHDVDVGVKTSDPNSPHGTVANQDYSVFTPSDTSDVWTSFEQTTQFNVEAFVAGFNAVNVQTSVEVRVLDVSSGDTYPGTDGVFLTNGAGSNTDSSTVITVPDDATDYDLQYKTNGDPGSSIIYYWYQAWGEHSHDVDIGTETSTEALGVNETSTEALGTTSSETSAEVTPAHTHDPEPGVVEFPAETASGVDLLVNGNTVATDIGSGTFTTTVDISGELTPGDNTIEAVSDSIGLINMTVQTQLFRQGQP